MKTRKVLLLCLLCAAGLISRGQGVGVKTTGTPPTPNAAAEMEVFSPNNNGGVLIPTLTTAQMNGIATPAEGLLVYNTNKNKFMYNAGTSTAKNWCVVGEFPRLTTAQMTANREVGRIAYCTDDNKWWVCTGPGASSWLELKIP